VLFVSKFDSGEAIMVKYGSNGKGSRENYDLPEEAFVVVWQAANSMREFEEMTGMPGPIASARANKYRLKGHNLKRMPRAKKGTGFGQTNSGISRSVILALKMLSKMVGGPKMLLQIVRFVVEFNEKP
jgi:hypothetical protein